MRFGAHSSTTRALLIAAACACGGPDALGQSVDPVTEETLRREADQSLDFSEAMARDAELEPESAPVALRFGAAGSQWLSIGTLAAYDFDSSLDLNIYGGWSNFLAEDLEFTLELAAWYFDQEGDDAAGLNANMVFRWHFVNEDPWSFFTEARIGLLAATDNVPEGGTGVDFTPGFGLGLTRKLSDDGLRLQAGARWHHISNGHIFGDERNPSRDGIAIYAGIVMPF